MKAILHLHDTACECELSYPHQEPPLQVAGPGGVPHLQPSPYGRFDVKLETGRTTVVPGSYTLRCSLGELKVEIERTEGDTAWGVRRVRESYRASCRGCVPRMCALAGSWAPRLRGWRPEAHNLSSAPQPMSSDPVTGPPPKESPREQGGRDYFRQKGQYHNPHPPGSADFNEYERGWMQSLKRDEGKLVSRPKPHTPPHSPPSTYNAYADLKGRSGPRK